MSTVKQVEQEKAKKLLEYIAAEDELIRMEEGYTQAVGERKALLEEQDQIAKILNELEKFQFTDASQCPVIKDKPFDRQVLLWETSYFLERYVQRICGIHDDFTAVKNEFNKLAQEVDALPKAIMHRDFQSENIMIKDDKIITYFEFDYIYYTTDILL